MTHGGRTPTGLDAVEWAEQACDLGAGEILLTSMDRDGTKAGYDIELLRAVGDAVDVPVIASGGVGTLEHLYEGVAAGGARAVLAASIFHFGQHSVREAKDYLAARGLPVREPFSAVPDQRRRTPVARPARTGGYRDRTSAGLGPGTSEGVLMPEPHYQANGATGIVVGSTVDDHFFRRYRELLDAEDAAFDELEHAYEDGDRAHFETRPRGVAGRDRAPR